ncbi:MAG: signal peptidase I [Novosphingobium sp.]|nr:signal peptidase I [Novosphingobium sp.]
MTDTTPAQSKSGSASGQSVPEDQERQKGQDKQENFFVFLLKLVLLVLVFRSFIFSPFNIPSESMLPRLLNGDYLLAAKWPYGYSRHSLPFSLPLIPGRIFASQPERGDVVIFKAPPDNKVDYIKRVIGLPGDQVQVRNGQLFLNGQAIPKRRIADFTVPVSPNTPCYRARFEARLADGSRVCRYPRFRETLPGGRSYEVLDLGNASRNNFSGIDADNTETVIVPDGYMFMMGDNRDNSLDSRFPAMPGGGIGLVPQANLVGKATIIMFSTDGSAEWLKPWTWIWATRWSRIGGTF